jgi:hypothetical protein
MSSLTTSFSKIPLYRQKPEATVDKILTESVMEKVVDVIAHFLVSECDKYPGSIFENDIKKLLWKIKRINDDLLVQEITNRMKIKPLPTPIPKSKAKKKAENMDIESQNTQDSLFSTHS